MDTLEIILLVFGGLNFHQIYRCSCGPGTEPCFGPGAIMDSEESQRGEEG